MKKLLVVMLVLSMASMANAALWITVNGGTDDITISPSDTVAISIWGDGTSDQSEYMLGIDNANPLAGTFNLDSAVILYTGSDAYINFTEAEFALIYSPGVAIGLNDVPTPGNPKAPLNGELVSTIILHCDGEGLVILDLLNPDWDVVLDSVSITQLPEPITLSLLGLGGLFLRRRK